MKIFNLIPRLFQTNNLNYKLISKIKITLLAKMNNHHFKIKILRIKKKYKNFNNLYNLYKSNNKEQKFLLHLIFLNKQSMKTKYQIYKKKKKNTEMLQKNLKNNKKYLKKKILNNSNISKSQCLKSVNKQFLILHKVLISSQK